MEMVPLLTVMVEIYSVPAVCVDWVKVTVEEYFVSPLVKINVILMGSEVGFMI
jgi:hypothetical protein